MATDRRIRDKKYNAKRKEKTARLVFNMNNEEDIILFEKFLKLQEINGKSACMTIKDLIKEKEI